MTHRIYMFGPAALSALLLGVAALLTGCSSGGVAQSQRTAASLEETRAELAEARVEAQRAVATVDGLRGAEAPAALTANFAQLDDVEDEVEDGRDDVREHLRDLRRQAADYRWQAQPAGVRDEVMRERVTERARTVNEQYDRVTAAALDAHEAYAPFLADLREAKSVLDRDLTPQGARAVDPLLERASEHGTQLLSRLDALLQELDTLIAELSPHVETASAE